MSSQSVSQSVAGRLGSVWREREREGEQRWILATAKGQGLKVWFKSSVSSVSIAPFFLFFKESPLSF